jgi:hypothetical protein
MPNGGSSTTRNPRRCVEEPYVTPPDLLHHHRDAIPRARRRQQVHMVRHQYVGVNLAAVLSSRIREAVQIQPVAALNDVKRDAGKR